MGMVKAIRSKSKSTVDVADEDDMNINALFCEYYQKLPHGEYEANITLRDAVLPMFIFGVTFFQIKISVFMEF